MSASLKKRGPGLAKIAGHLSHRLGHEQPVVAVGVLGSTSARGDGKIDNVGLAVVHEYGLGAPERSFLRSTFDARKEDWYHLAGRLLGKVTRGLIPLDQALGLIGLRAQADIRKRIVDGIPPPNALSTIKAKGSSTPLIDTDRLLGSISFEVRSKK